VGSIFDKKYQELEIKDLIGSKEFKNGERFDQALKKFYIIKKKKELKNSLNKCNELGYVVTHCEFDTVGTFNIIADRMIEKDLKKASSYYDNWYFTIVCTYEEFREDFEGCYHILKNKYSNYNRDNFEFYVQVIGGVSFGADLVGYKEEKEWREKDVLIVRSGFSDEGKVIYDLDLATKKLENFKREVEQIKEKGKPETIHEAKMLKLDRDGDKLMKELFGINILDQNRKK